MDVTFVDGLEISTIIGVAAWERVVPQRLLLDLELGGDLAPAGRSDSLAQANDYAAVAKRVQVLAEAARFHLIEAFAEAVADDLLQRFAPAWVRVSVAKPGAVSGAKAVGVRIERGGTSR